MTNVTGTPTATGTVGAITSPGSTSGVWSANGTQQVSTSSNVDKDMFLKLLVAQLKYQDPSNPTDSSQFMAQTAQFTQVEKLDELAQQNAQLLATQQMLNGAALVGRTVTYPGADGTPATGVVTAVKFGGDTPTLHIGDTDVPITQVTTVSAGTATAGGSSQTSSQAPSRASSQ